MTTTDKPKFGDTHEHTDWVHLADAPGQIAKHDSSGGAYSDDETERVGRWLNDIEGKYGEKNVCSGRALRPGPDAPFGLYVRKSALQEEGDRS